MQFFFLTKLYKQNSRNKIVIVKTTAERRLEKKYNPVIEISDKIIPNNKAALVDIFPSGRGLKHVLLMTLSISDSYHIFNAPAAPAPTATKNKLKHESIKLILFGEILNQLMQ